MDIRSDREKGLSDRRVSQQLKLVNNYVNVVRQPLVICTLFGQRGGGGDSAFLFQIAAV